MANRIYIQVDYQDDNAQKQIDQINQKIAGIGTSSTKATAEATKGVQSFSVAIDQAQSHVDSLSQALVGMGIGQAIREMITLGDQLNRTMAAMSAMSGGVEGMNKLRAAADALALDWDNVSQAANRLRNAGLQMNEIVPIIQAIGAHSVTAGGDIQQNFTRAIDAVADSANKRFITIKGLLDQMGRVGVQVMPILQKALGESVAQVREDIRNLSPKALFKEIVDGSGDVAAAAKKIADNSPVAALAVSKNAAEDFAATLTKVLGPGIIQLLEALRPLIDMLTAALEAFNKLPAPVKNLTVLILALAASIKAVNTALALNAALTGAGLFGGIATGAKAAVAAVGEFLAGAGEITTILGGTVAMATGLGEILAVVAAIGSALFIAYQWFKKLDEEKKNAAPATPDKMPPEGPLLNEDIEKILKEREQAANALSEAQKRHDAAALQGIAAVAAEYEVLYRAVTKVKDAEALATAQRALALNVATEVLKHSQEMHKENIKAAEEDAAVARKIAIAQASVVPDDSFAGRRELAQLTADEEQKQIQEQSAIRMAEQKKITTDQIANIATLYKAGKLSAEEALKDRKDAEAAYTEYYIDQTQLAIDKGREAGLKGQRAQNELILEEHKQLQEELLQDSLNRIQQEANLTAAYASAVQAHTVAERLQQIQTVEKAQLDSIEKTRDAQIGAAQEALQYYIAQHPGGAGVGEEQKKAMREEARLRAAAETEMQLDRIKAWKDGNEVIIEQQKQVYEQIQGLFGQLFDAFTEKSKSVWAAVGNVIKNALLGAIKSVVTSQLAAQLTGLLGFGSVTFKQGGLGSLIPVFSGAGAPPQPATVSSDLKVLSDAIAAPSPSQGGANRTVDDVISDAQSASLPGYTPATYTPVPSVGGGLISQTFSPMGGAGVGTAYGGFGTGTAGGTGHIGGSGAYSPAAQINSLKNTLNIGKPIMINGQAVPWAQASTSARLGAIAQSPGVSMLALGLGSAAFFQGIKTRGIGGAVQTIGGATAAGYGAVPMLAAAFPGANITPAGGALLGAGIGLTAQGLKMGGLAGMGLDVAGGALAGAMIGNMVAPIVGMIPGALIGAAAGAIAGGIRMLIPGQLQTAHDRVLQAYGVNITNNNILQQIVDLANQKYGGDIRLTVMSTEVQDMVRLYAMSTGQLNHANLPRPMYSATFAQSQAGGLQLQPVYSGGQLVANPYTGTTTTQVSQALSQSVFLQLNPNHAQALFAGQVVQVMGNNPGAVAAANTTAIQSGQSRQAQAGALLEPATVMR